MSHIAVKTRGIGLDYRWQKEKADVPAAYKLLELESLSDDNSLSIVLYRGADTFDCLISGISTPQHDVKGRPIRFAVASGQMDEGESRRLIYAFLTSREACEEKLRGAFQWKEKADDGDWTVDFPALRNALSEIAGSVSLNAGSTPFADAWERKRTPEAEQTLAKEILNHSFSKKTGVKLVVADAPQGYSRICAEADRLLWSEAEERKLARAPDLAQPPERCAPQEGRPPLPNPPKSTKRIPVIVAVSLFALAIAAILFIGLKKKARIMAIEPDGAVPHAFIVRFDSPMDTKALPEVQFTPNDVVKIESLEWQTPTSLRLEVGLPDAIRVQIKNARTAQGGKLVPYSGKLQLTPERN